MYKNKIEKVCLFCGLTFFARPSQIRIGQGNFCSQKCSNQNKKTSFQKENNPNWMGNKRKSAYQFKLEHKSRFPEKVKARDMVRDALRSKIILKLPCSVCNNPNSEAHHEDYSKPLDVIWLCKIHHLEIHAKNN